MPCVFELLENPTVAALLGAVIGAAIGGFSSYIITVRVSRRTELNQAAADFRVAFADERRALMKSVDRPEDVAEDFTMTTLANAEAKHANACILFSPYLSDKKKRQFDQAWEDYRCPGGGGMAELPSPFIDYYSDSRHEIPIKLALEKLGRLMEFGKPK